MKTINTPYLNTVHFKSQPSYPGDRVLERRLKSIIRWNAMAMVVRSNHLYPGIGGHISTYASAATLYETGFQHFFRAPSDDFTGDLGDSMHPHPTLSETVMEDAESVLGLSTNLYRPTTRKDSSKETV